MAGTYYKYAEQQAEQQIDWSVVGKTISDTLMDANKVREEKKALIDKNTSDYLKYVQESPQGQFKDGNDFTNNFAHSMMEQQLIDSKLLKSGQMKLQDYTLRRQNYKDGTDTLFSLSKMYQDVYKKRMEGLLSGGLQALNGANMKLVEGFADFSKSKAFINPTTGVVNIGMLKTNEKTGNVEVDPNSMVPVNVLKGKIQAEIPTFDVNGAMDKTVKGLGDVVRTIYKGASRSTYGTIEKLTGVLAMDDGKNPQFKKEIDLFNKAIEQQVSSYFANPYNLTSVLTENLGKYDQDSFTYNKDEADKDPSKILLKINQSTGLGTLDENGKNYKAQEAEARDWVKTQIKSRLANERVITTTATTPYGPQPTQASIDAAAGKKDKQAAAGAWNQLYTGKTAAEKQAAADILLGTPIAMEQGLMDIDLTKPGYVKLKFLNPRLNREIPMIDKKTNRPISLIDFAGKGVQLHGVVDRNEAVRAGGGGTGFGNPSNWTSIIAKREGGVAPEVETAINITPDLFTIKSKNSVGRLKNILPKGFNVSDIGGILGNDVKVIAPNKKEYIYNANLDPEEVDVELEALQKFINDNNVSTTTTPAAAGATTTTTTPAAGGVNYGSK